MPHFFVTGDRRFVPPHVWNEMVGLPHPPEGFACDGCTFSPDYLFGVDVWIAGVIHDFHYEDPPPLGGTWHGRREADRALRDNIRRLFELKGEDISAQYLGRARWLEKLALLLGLNEHALSWAAHSTVLRAYRVLGGLVACAYYGRVRIWGPPAYFYDEGECPLGFFARVREVWGAWKPTAQALVKVLAAKGVGRTKP